MNWNISAWSIKRPVPSIVLFIILTVAGLFSYFALGIDENPNIDVPTVMVTVSEPGAAPSELETQVTRKIEDAVAGLGNIKHITSTINDGASTTSIEFELGTDSDRALNDVRDAVARIRVQLPQAILDPVVQRLDFMGGPFVSYTISSKTRSAADLSWIVDNDISRALLSIPGVGQVQRSGGVDREIRVDLDPNKLDAVGATADVVSGQVRALNANLPGGRADIGGAEQSIRTLGSAQSVEQLKNAHINLTTGGFTTLSNLGNVSDSSAEPQQMALLDGQPVVAFSVVRSTGSNLVEVGDRVDAALKKLQKTLPDDIQITKIRTNARYVTESYHATIDSLLIGAALAVAVIWFFLRDWRAAGISAIAMPLSMIPTFWVMKWLGYTLNNMSLLALALVIGILVDDAIVEIENIVRHIHMGKSPYRAALEAADEIGLAVVATTMTIIVVFLPVAFMGGIPGQFFKQFGITVAVSVFFSLLVARLLTPMMAAYWLKTVPDEDSKSRLHEIYDRLLGWALNNRKKTVITAAVVAGASIAMMGLLPTSLINSADRGETVLSVQLQPGAELEDTTRTSQRVTNILRKHPEVAHVFASIGTPSTGGSMTSRGSGTVNQASLYVILKPRGERKLSQEQFEQAVRPELATVPGARMSFSAAMGLGGKVQILLTGQDGDQLQQRAEMLTNEMRAMPNLYDVSSSAALRRPEIQVVPDYAMAADQGVSVQQIAHTANIATVGDIDSNLPKFDLPERQINIRVALDPKYREDVQTISNMKITGVFGRQVPLGSVARVEFGSGPAQIDRRDRNRQVTITGSLAPGTTLGEALKQIHQLPSLKTLPAGISQMPTGDVEIQRDVFGGFGTAIGAAVLLIYAVLVLLFNDFMHPFTIMMSLPLAIGGAALGLMAFHQPLGLYALIGIVMLMGLVTKNAILLVEYCLMSMHNGMSRHEAIVTAGEARMRPILMTTVAMIAGMVPIALGIGAGSEVRAPMALAVIGGLITSTFLTLIVVPVVFTYVDDWKMRVFAGRKHDEQEHEPASEQVRQGGAGAAPTSNRR